MLADLITFIEKNCTYYTIEYTPQSIESVYCVVIDKGFARGQGATLEKCLENSKKDLIKSIEKRKKLIGI